MKRFAAALALVLISLSARAGSLPVSTPLLPDFVPPLKGMQVSSDVTNSVPSSTRVPVAVSRTIDPSAQHEIVIFGTTREISWKGTQKRSLLEAALREALSQGGFKVLLDTTSKTETVLTAKRNSELDETWVVMSVKKGSVDLRSVRSSISRIRNIGEAELTTGELDALSLQLEPPADQAEPITDVDDFPFLRHVPGLDILTERSRVAQRPFVTIVDGQTVTVDGPVTERLYYQGSVPVSTYRSLVAYREGLKKAGWEIGRVDAGEFRNAVEFFAHYTRNQRDLWTHITILRDTQRIEVADPGTSLNTAALVRELTGGHLTIYGIHFDHEGTVVHGFEGTLDRLAKAILQVSKADLKYSLIAHVEERDGPGAANLIANAAVRELLSRGVAEGVVQARGKADLPDRASPQLPSQAYVEIVKR